jgi:hypothetical protein
VCTAQVTEFAGFWPLEGDFLANSKRAQSSSPFNGF